MLEFKKITIEDKTHIKKYLRNKEQFACEFTFGNNILWDVDGLMEYAVVEDVLLYRMMETDKNIYCMPDFGKKAKELLDLIEDDAQRCGRKYCITCLSENMADTIRKIYPGKFRYTCDAAHSDYIYLVQKLATLSGKKLHRKKNHWNHFTKNQEFVYEKISKENIEDCRKMKNEWCKKRLTELSDDKTASEERKSMLWEAETIDLALTHFDEFDFTGGLIRIDGKVSAFTLGEPVNDTTFVVHFEKAFADVNGLYTAMNKLFVEQELLGKYEYVNREEDMGLPGLRQAKMSYYPELIYEKWVAAPVSG